MKQTTKKAVNSQAKAETVVSLQVKAGEAMPGPPIGPSLAPHGIKVIDFCSAFNAQTKEMERGIPIPVKVTIYPDRTFTFTMKSPPAAFLIKKQVLKGEKGSATPKKAIVGTATRAQLEAVVKIKKPDLTAADLEAAVRTIAGTARSMGILYKETVD